MEPGKCGRNGNTNEPFWGCLAPANSRCRVFKIIENAQSRLVKVPAWLSQCDRTRRAVNQFGAEFQFKGGDLFADSGLADATFFRDSGEVPFLNDSDERLRIMVFFGTIENAVKTQIWIAISVYLLVAIVKKRLDLPGSLYTLLQALSVTLFEKMPISQALQQTNCTNPNLIKPSQLPSADCS